VAVVANRDAAGTDVPAYERWDAGGAEWLRDDGRQLRLAFAPDPVPTRADVWVLQPGACFHSSPGSLLPPLSGGERLGFESEASVETRCV
jgi:hypothetical protein